MIQNAETLESLAGKISEHSQAIASFLSSQNLPAPTLSAENVAEYPQAPELQGHRLMLMELLMDMLHLTMSGSEFLFIQSLVVRNSLPKSPIKRNELTK